MRIVNLLAPVALLFTAPLASAAAGPACAFDVYQPEALVHELLVNLPSSGIAVVDLNRDAEATSERKLLMRDNAIVGELYASVDVRAAKSEMTVISAAGDVLMHFEAARGKIEGYTELEGPLDGRPAYSVHKPDGGMPAYYRYDAKVSRLEFRRALISSFDWLVATLDATDVTREPISATVAERFYWQLAAQPAVAPYLSRLTIETRRGELIVSGVVPSNFVYDQVVRAALDAELWNVRPDLVIDTRTDVPDRRWILSRCL